MIIIKEVTYILTSEDMESTWNNMENTHEFYKLYIFPVKYSIQFNSMIFVKEKVVVIHRGRCNNKVYYCLSPDVVTWDVDRDISTAYC